MLYAGGQPPAGTNDANRVCSSVAGKGMAPILKEEN